MLRKRVKSFRKRSAVVERGRVGTLLSENTDSLIAESATTAANRPALSARGAKAAPFAVLAGGAVLFSTSAKMRAGEFSDRFLIDFLNDDELAMVALESCGDASEPFGR